MLKCSCTGTGIMNEIFLRFSSDGIFSVVKKQLWQTKDRKLRILTIPYYTYTRKKWLKSTKLQCKEINGWKKSWFFLFLSGFLCDSVRFLFDLQAFAKLLFVWKM